MKIKKQFKVNKEGIELCPKCSSYLYPIWENNGWGGEEGPRMDEVTGVECKMCGFQE